MKGALYKGLGNPGAVTSLIGSHVQAVVCAPSSEKMELVIVWLARSRLKIGKYTDIFCLGLVAEGGETFLRLVGVRLELYFKG